MTPMFLSPEELAELTDFKSTRKQIEWLDDHRWIYAKSAFGRPKVLRDYAVAKLGGGAAPAPPLDEPDFSHWIKRANP